MRSRTARPEDEGLLREVVKQQDKYASQVVMSILEQEYFQQYAKS